MKAEVYNYGGFYVAYFYNASGEYRGMSKRATKAEIKQACKEYHNAEITWLN